MKTKFKVCDKVYREYTITKIIENNSYAIKCNSNNGTEETFTFNGNYLIDKAKEFFTQEELLAKLQPKSKYPKWMYVDDTPIVDTKDALKRYIVGEDNSIYIAVSSYFTEDDISKNIGKDKLRYCAWKYAEDISQESFQKEVVLNRIYELEQEINNLKMEAEKL